VHNREIPPLPLRCFFQKFIQFYPICVNYIFDKEFGYFVLLSPRLNGINNRLFVYVQKSGKRASDEVKFLLFYRAEAVCAASVPNFPGASSALHASISSKQVFNSAHASCISLNSSSASFFSHPPRSAGMYLNLGGLH
jgi:hypothetical protein